MRVERVASATFAVLLVLALGQNSYSIIMHNAAQGDSAWQQEYVDLGKSFDSVVGVYGYNGTSWQNIGSGTLISPHHVIGAAHSALDDNWQTYENYAVVPGNHLVTDYWGIYHTTTVAIHPGFTNIIVSPDMAIWTLDDAIPDVTPATLYTGNDSDMVGSLVDLIGFGYYGYPSTGQVAIDGAKRGCQNELTRIGWPLYGADTDQLLFKFAAPGDAAYEHLGGGGASYDSGGGMFVSGQNTLVGVLDFGIAPFQYDGYTGGTSISQHIDWINSVIGVPEPGTVVLLVPFIGCLLVSQRR